MSNQFAKARCSQPLAVIGLETTGLNPAQDRITKITILRIEPSNAVTSYAQRIQVSQDSAEDWPSERDMSATDLLDSALAVLRQLPELADDDHKLSDIGRAFRILQN